VFQQTADVTGTDVVMFGCNWYIYQIILKVLRTATVNIFSLVEKINPTSCSVKFPVPAANTEDDLLQKITFLIIQGTVATLWIKWTNS